MARRDGDAQPEGDCACPEPLNTRVIVGLQTPLVRGSLASSTPDQNFGCRFRCCLFPFSPREGWSVWLVGPGVVEMSLNSSLIRLVMGIVASVTN